METELEGEADVPAAAPPDVPTKIVQARALPLISFLSSRCGSSLPGLLADRPAPAAAVYTIRTPLLLCLFCQEEVAVPLAARVLRFDYDGRSDGRSMRTMLAHVAPRRCVLVHGPPQVGCGWGLALGFGWVVQGASQDLRLRAPFLGLQLHSAPSAAIAGLASSAAGRLATSKRSYLSLLPALPSLLPPGHRGAALLPGGGAGQPAGAGVCAGAGRERGGAGRAVLQVR